MASAVLYVVACWGSRLKVADTNRLNKLICKDSNVEEMELDTFKVVLVRQMMSRINDVLASERSTFSERL